MTMIVGYTPDARGKAAVRLGQLLARSAGEDLVVCVVVPAPWSPGMARIDAEYRAELAEIADRALERARELVHDDVPTTFDRREARSAPAGLLELAEERNAGMLVLSSAGSGLFGQVTLGSVTDRLLHSSPVPIALATRGFTSKPGSRVTRVTVAYGGSAISTDLTLAAATVTAQVGASFRVASFAVWSRTDYTTRLGREPSESILEQWRSEVAQAGTEALAKVRSLPDPPADVEAVIGQANTWQGALDDVPWDDGDVLVVGSSELGPVRRVFLGSRGSKILRYAPVPVVVVPRGALEEVASPEPT